MWLKMFTYYDIMSIYVGIYISNMGTARQIFTSHNSSLTIKTTTTNVSMYYRSIGTQLLQYCKPYGFVWKLGTIMYHTTKPHVFSWCSHCFLFVSIPHLRRTPSQLLVTYPITSTWQYIASSILVKHRTCVMKHDEAISVFGCASHLVHVHHLQISFRNPKRFSLCQGQNHVIQCFRIIQQSPHSNASFFNGAENPRSNCLRSKQTKQWQYSMVFH